MSYSQGGLCSPATSGKLRTLKILKQRLRGERRVQREKENMMFCERLRENPTRVFVFNSLICLEHVEHSAMSFVDLPESSEKMSMTR